MHAPTYHPGEAAVQQRAGDTPNKPHGSVATRPEIPVVAQRFLRDQPLIVLGAPDQRGWLWATALAGAPGFVDPLDERTIAIRAPLPTGDPLASAFTGSTEIGMLAIEPATRRRMRINGRAGATGDGLLLHTDQVYANCPKYLTTRDHPRPVTRRPGPPLISTELSPAQQRMLAAADTFFAATFAGGHGADVSHRGGNPGFVQVTGPTTLSWPDYSGNKMYMTLGNLELDARCGLLFVDWRDGHLLHLTGTASADWSPARTATVPGALRMIDFEVRQVVEQPSALPLTWDLITYSRFNPRSPGD